VGLSYDAWGRRRNADGSDDAGAGWGSLKNTQDHSGYTGHEHLDQLGLVHMNARLYDPIVGRHTSADPTVPDPANLQSLNRYSYVLNNALAFVDPTGLAPEKEPTSYDFRSICGPNNTHGCGGTVYNPPESAGGQSLGSRLLPITTEMGQRGTPPAGPADWGSAYLKFTANSILDRALGPFGELLPRFRYKDEELQPASTYELISAVGNTLVGGRAVGNATKGVKTAESVADDALAAGAERGAVAELNVNGRLYTDVSTGIAPRSAPLHPRVEQVLATAPKKSPYHGFCAEPGCVSKALRAGEDVRGATIRAVNVGKSGRSGHGTPKDLCVSCRWLSDQLGIKHD
jgi:RHS repeat-associated protein